MKRLSIYILLLFLLFSCKGNEASLYTIQGNGVTEGAVYLWSTDERHRELSSTVSNGSFSFSIPLSNATRLMLALPDGNVVTLFAEPGQTAALQPDSMLKSGWRVKGGSTQALHDSISRILDEATDISKQKKIIEEFSKKYPLSEVNVELFRRYLIDIPNPDNEYIRKAISKLSGPLQDNRYIATANKLLDKKNGNVKHRMFPTFNYTTADSIKTNIGRYSDKYLLVNVWATWHNGSREQLQELRSIRDSVRSENFAILNISIDCDSTAWLNAITNDSIIGDNVIEPKGMNSDILEIFNITSLPYSVLVTPYKRIAEYNLPLDSVTAATIDSLTHKHDTKNQKKEEKKDKEKKKNNRIKI